VLEAPRLAQRFEGLAAEIDGSAVRPDDRGANRVVVLTDENEAVHLVGETDGRDGLGIEVRLLPKRVGNRLHVPPPSGGGLFSPPRSRSLHGHFFVRWRPSRRAHLTGSGL